MSPLAREAKRDYDVGYHIAHREKRRRIRDELRARLAAIKLARGCADCGYRIHSDALDFDHLPGQEKRFSLNRATTHLWSDIEAEISKCEVVCANCHRIRTAQRRQGFHPDELGMAIALDTKEADVAPA